MSIKSFIKPYFILPIIVIAFTLFLDYLFIHKKNGPIWKQITENFKELEPVKIYYLDTLKGDETDSIYIEKKEAILVYDLDCAKNLIPYYENKKESIPCNIDIIRFEAEHQLIEYTKDSLLARVKISHRYYSNNKWYDYEERGYVYYKTVHKN